MATLSNINKGRKTPIKGKPPSTRTPNVPSATPKPMQPFQDPGYAKKGAGNPVYKSEGELRAARTSGVISEGQYKSAQTQLLRGARGVDPLGFGNARGASTGGLSLDELQNKAKDEYTQFGAVSPETEAMIAQMENPELAAQEPVDPSGKAGIRQRVAPAAPVPPTRAAIKEKPKILTGADLQAAAEKRRKQRLAEYNIGEEQYAQVKSILDRGGRIAGTENGQILFMWGDGRSETVSISESDAKKAEEVATTDFEGEIKNEQQSQADALKNQEMSQIFAQYGAEGPQTTRMLGEVDGTIASLQALMANSSGISQQVFAAYLPSIMNRLGRAQDMRARIEAIDTEAEREDIVDERVSGTEALAALREKQLTARVNESQAILKENKAIALDANRLATESLELDKKLVEARNAEDEIRQEKLNIEGEKQLRRSMNAAGIETSPLGQEYLQGKIQEAADHLSTMRQTNNLTLLKFGVAREQLANGVKEVLSEFQSKRADLFSRYDDAIFNLDEVVNQSRSDAYDDIKKELKDLTAEEDKLMIEAGDKIAEAGAKATEIQSAAETETRKSMIKATDLFSFTNSIRSQINSDKVISNANDVDSFYGAMEAGYNEYVRILADPSANQESLNAAQTTMVGSFARILDPGSVVRNEEYERQLYGQSWWNTAKGLFEKAQRGGAGLTQQDVASMKKVADQIHIAWESRLNTQLQRYIPEIDLFNTQPGVGNGPGMIPAVRYDQVLPVDRVYLPDQTVTKWRQDAGVSTPSAVSTSPVAMTAPPQGFRTDRHNNPTAFTTDIAKIAGLQLGVDYEIGDAFPDNPNYHTARLTGDPINTTIRVIDKIGFYTQGGKQRWTHTAIDKKAWDSMTYQQKTNVIKKMYGHEGGSGQFFASSTDNLA